MYGKFQPNGPMTEDLLNSIIEQKNTLPERLFVSDFLPIFAGKVPLEKVQDFIKVWVSIAGSPSAPVDIIDHNEKVLFTVPGIFDSSFIDPNRSEGAMNFAEIVHFAKLHNGISPALEQSVFVKNVQKKLDAMQKKSPSFAKNIKAWAEIFARYNITNESKEEKTSSLNNTVSKTNNVSDDDFE